MLNKITESRREMFDPDASDSKLLLLSLNKRMIDSIYYGFKPPQAFKINSDNTLDWVGDLGVIVNNSWKVDHNIIKKINDKLGGETIKEEDQTIMYKLIMFLDKNKGKPIIINKLKGNLSIDIKGQKCIDDVVVKEVEGKMHIFGNSLTSFENFPVKITGSLTIPNNPNITSLEGFPKYVGGNLSWAGMRIFNEEDIREVSDIKGKIDLTPADLMWFFSERIDYFVNTHDNTITVKGDIDCSYNRNKYPSFPFRVTEVTGSFRFNSNSLITLKNGPEKVWGRYDISNNKLTSLMYGPRLALGGFNCSNNKMLKSLKYAPILVNGEFDCKNCGLTSLKGIEKSNINTLVCSDNNLKDFIGAPNDIREDFICLNNPMTSINGFPSHIGGTVWCDTFTEEEIRAVCKVDGEVKDKKYFDEYKSKLREKMG